MWSLTNCHTGPISNFRSSLKSEKSLLAKWAIKWHYYLGPDTGISSKVFTEAMASHLCHPSPAVDLGGWVGKNTVRGGALIDHYGDTGMNCKHLPGDTWRQRHDTGRLAIVNECVNAGLVHDCEVIGLFADLIPAQAENHRWEDLQWRRPRQGLIPDFRLRLPIPWRASLPTSRA